MRGARIGGRCEIELFNLVFSEREHSYISKPPNHIHYVGLFVLFHIPV